MLDKKDILDYCIDRNLLEIEKLGIISNFGRNVNKITLREIKIFADEVEKWKEEKQSLNLEPFRYRVFVGFSELGCSEYACYEDGTFIGKYTDLIQGKDRYKWLGIPTVPTCNDLIGAVATGITTGDNLNCLPSNSICDTDSSYRYITKKETEDLITNIINDKEGEKKDMKEYLCPKCGAPLKVKTSRFGVKFWGCTNYPECCNFTANYEDYEDFTNKITNDDCQNCKPHKCNETCPCYRDYCECDDDVTPLDALLYGCDLKGVYINDNNNTITAVDKDGKSFSAKVSGGDEFDPRIGVALVLAYNFMGSKGAFNSAIKELMNSKQYHIEKKVKKDEKKDDNETKEQQ